MNSVPLGEIENGCFLEKKRPKLDERRIIEIEGNQFVKYAGLLDYAHQIGIGSIEVEPLQLPTKDNGNFAICKAIVVSKVGEFGLNEDERKAVEWAWPQEAGDTMFAVVNSYTRAAHFKKLSAETSYKLQRVGGNPATGDSMMLRPRKVVTFKCSGKLRRSVNQQ